MNCEGTIASFIISLHHHHISGADRIVSHNRMTGIVPNLTALIQLNTLNASNNQLTGNLAGIAAVVSLSVLDLSQNQVI